ncbi:branched-chain amino acid ABC transporter permease [Halomonas sp.]|uniref:branched-chain amino acid ABC transporter permease n=1 Tax=Halomonas sp. TaxID=1486246 RepID=UPI0035679A5E
MKNTEVADDDDVTDDRAGAGSRIGPILRSRTALAVLFIALGFGLWLLAGAPEVPAKQLLSLTVWGVMLGGVLALGSIGLTLVYGVLQFPNFSHGALITLGAYIAYAVIGLLPPGSELGPFSFGWEFLLALFIAMPLVGVVALAVDRLIYRRLRNQRAGLVLFAMASLGMAFFLRSCVYMIWGPDFHFYYQGRSNPAMELPLGVRVQADQLFIVALAMALVVAVYLLLTKTRMGKAMRATADNPELAQVRGINTEHVIALTWILSGALAAAAGVMYGLTSQLRPEMGFWLLLPIFAGTIMGGIGNPFGALVGAMIIGIVTQVTAAFISPAYGPAVAFILMVVTLVIRPQGLFGGSA